MAIWLSLISLSRARSAVTMSSPADPDLARSRLDQPVDAADQRRFAGARQAHHHEGLALFDIEGDVGHGEDVAGLAVDVVLRPAGAEELQRDLRVRPENLEDAPRPHLRWLARH
jgi:hypothetical protein